LKTVSIIIAGVGGQGNIAASKIIGEAAIRSGYDVKITETHGMAQRGGSVHSMIRFGKKVYSPLIPKGEAGYLISLEYLEGLRWLSYLSEEAIILVSTEKRPPYLVSIGKASYPENTEEVYSQFGKAIFIPARELALEAGSAKAANVVMLGALSCFLKDISSENLKEEVKRKFAGKDKLVELNLKAFEIGRNFVRKDQEG
jgi:indolepyruvate ferredoxin oxidoreductase beta subunit